MQPRGCRLEPLPLVVVARIQNLAVTKAENAQGDDYEPEVGPLGKHPGGGIQGKEDGDLGHGEDDPAVGVIGNDPPHIVAQGLLCFNDKHIYSKCEESYRLTESGELHVPVDHVPEFCTGPCLEETNLVLHCLDGIMEHFLFFNKATTKDVRDTILVACSHGGDLDVAEHIEADGGGTDYIGSKATIYALLGIVITFLGQIFLL